MKPKRSKRIAIIGYKLWRAMAEINRETFKPGQPETIISPQEWLRVLDDMRAQVLEYEAKGKNDAVG